MIVLQEQVLVLQLFIVVPRACVLTAHGHRHALTTQLYSLHGTLGRAEGRDAHVLARASRDVSSPTHPVCFNTPAGKGLPILIVLRNWGKKEGEKRKSWDSSRGKSVAPETPREESLKRTPDAPTKNT